MGMAGNCFLEAFTSYLMSVIKSVTEVGEAACVGTSRRYREYYGKA